MKTRESSMPEEERWETFFDPNFILNELGMGHNCQAVADLGCGYGTFSIPAARLISGKVYSIDIDPLMVAACQEKVVQAKIANIICQQRDFVADVSGLPDQSMDFVMLFNILHAENPIDLLKESARILVSGGKVGVIHWNYDPTTPRGPSMSIRPHPEQCQAWVQAAGFELLKPFIDFPPYHYGMTGLKSGVIVK